MSALSVTFLGTGTSMGVPVPTCRCEVCTSADPRDRRLRPSALLRWGSVTVLIDTSSDLRQQALLYDIDRVDAVLYTHGHADHILGLDDLRLYNWRQGRPVPVYGSPGTLEALRRTFWYVFDSEPSENTRPAIRTNSVSEPFALHGRTVAPVPALHGSLPILGYRVGRFAYLTDVSVIPESSYALLDGLEVLVLNALRERPHPTHFSLEQALAQAERIGAGRTFLTHMSHEVGHDRVSASLPPGVALAHDGLRVEIEDEP